MVWRFLLAPAVTFLLVYCATLLTRPVVSRRGRFGHQRPHWAAAILSLAFVAWRAWDARTMGGGSVLVWCWAGLFIPPATFWWTTSFAHKDAARR